ncbi:MAG: hypothetical protein IKF39_01250 [Oscillospiraceae bacterium]|nr:hypothetical protein [Oscillospiraceae bacterium]
MSFRTLWGYELTDADEMPDLLSVEDFNTFTANRFVGDVRIPKELESASMAIRNYVGWHLYPEEACKLKATMQGRRITCVGADILIQLPAKYVTEVETVTVNGKAHEFSFETNGTLRVYDVDYSGLKRYSEVVVEYTAGLPDQLMGAVMELTAHRLTHALASSNGVTSETAGGVSITYNANWINSARATALPDDNKEVLAPYKLQGVF